MGEKKGVLISAYDVNRFEDIFKNDFIGGFAEIGILNSRGEVVVGKDVTEFKKNVPDALSPVEFTNSSTEEMRASLANGISGFSSYCVKGVERYCAFAPVKLNDWYVIVMVTENALRKTLSHFEKYGLQLTIELLTIMSALLLTIIAAKYKEHKKGQTILRHAAMTDGLTGIYNRLTAGIALSGECGNSFVEMYQKADESLYRAKEQGKGRFSL